MNIITIQNLSKSKSEKLLFDDISFGINNGQKIALIGVNGTGKSTLLKILAGLEKPDKGLLTSNNHLKVKYLSQEMDYRDSDTIFDHLFSAETEMIQLLKEYEISCKKLANNYNNENQKNYDEISKEMDRINAWQFENELKSILSQLGLNNLDLKMNSLSGGMLKKVSLAQVILEESDFIILDEPTNHLDLKTIEWLEKQLISTKKTIIMVTHDRYFLDKVCNTIIEIDKQKIFHYNGNYNYYLEKKEERLELDAEKSAKIKNTLRTEIDWLRRQPKARAGKQKARIDKIHRLMKERTHTSKHDFDFTVNGRRLGKKILELEEISKSFSEKTVFKNFTYVFKNKERIGIIGPNGSGKTTFLDIVSGRIQIDSGSREIGLNTKFAYFSQHSFHDEEDITVIDYIKEAGTAIDIGGKEPVSAGRFLEHFNFNSSMQYTKLSKLSGGEKRRLHLVRLLISNPNFLILDEPTNDLDIDTLTKLETFLDSYNGCVLIVSHDRYFMDKVADQLFIFSHDTEIKSFPGNYSDYLLFSNELSKEKQKEEKINKKPHSSGKEKKQKLSFYEKKEFEEIEQEIEGLEIEKAKLETFFQSPPDDQDLMNMNSARYEELKSLIDQKMARWELLAEKS